MHPAVLMVSKPVAPPWNDSSKNLVKDLALHGQRFTYHVMTPADYTLDGNRVVSEPLYAGGGHHTPALRQNLRVLRRLLRRDETVLTHFFFAPNPRTSLAARFALRLRSRRTIQTVCSAPARFEQGRQLLFADHVVVLSKHTRDALAASGVPASRLSLIPPGIELPPLPTHEQRAQIRERHGLPLDHALVIYPGDYQFSRAADTVARSIVASDRPQTTYIFACRIKQDASRQEEQRIQRLLQQSGRGQHVRFFNQVPDMLDLLGACDLCILPAESLYAKMDLPLVLIEAMALGVPLVVADQPPLSEILVGDVGVAVPPGDAEALARAVGGLLDAADRRAAMSTVARQLAHERFRIERVAQLYEDLYREVLQG